MDVGMKMLGYALSVCERVLLHLSMYRGLIIIWNKQMFGGNKTYTTEEEKICLFLIWLFMWLVIKMIQLVCATVCVYFFFFFFAYTPACQSSRWLLLEHINITRAHFQVYLLPIIEGKWLKAEGLLRVVAERRKTNHLFRHMDGQTYRQTNDHRRGQMDKVLPNTQPAIPIHS